MVGIRGARIPKTKSSAKQVTNQMHLCVSFGIKFELLPAFV